MTVPSGWTDWVVADTDPDPDPAGSSPWTDFVIATTGSRPLIDTPTGFTVTPQVEAGAPQLEVTWSAVDGAQEYNLQVERLDGDVWILVFVDTVSGSPQTVTDNIAFATTYRGRVRAVAADPDLFDPSEWTDWAEDTTPAEPVPGTYDTYLYDGDGLIPVTVTIAEGN